MDLKKHNIILNEIVHSIDFRETTLKGWLEMHENEKYYCIELNEHFIIRKGLDNEFTFEETIKLKNS